MTYGDTYVALSSFIISYLLSITKYTSHAYLLNFTHVINAISFEIGMVLFQKQNVVDLPCTLHLLLHSMLLHLHEAVVRGQRAPAGVSAPTAAP